MSFHRALLNVEELLKHSLFLLRSPQLQQQQKNPEWHKYMCKNTHYDPNAGNSLFTEPSNQVNKWTRKLSKQFSKKEVQWPINTQRSIQHS
jgi:hypothetical protein